MSQAEAIPERLLAQARAGDGGALGQLLSSIATIRYFSPI
jgi:hypothetical protein